MNPFSELGRRLAVCVHAMSLSCSKAAKLQSQAIHRPLSRSERIGLRVHLALCGWCSRYGEEVRFLRTATENHSEDSHTQADCRLSQEARERIGRRIQTAQG